jgi:hypothetical protein
MISEISATVLGSTDSGLMVRHVLEEIFHLLVSMKHRARKGLETRYNL